MSGPARWWWIRHAPVINPDGAIYGQRDILPDLADRARFASLARRLPAGAVWLATPLRRTWATAELLAELRGERPDIGLEPELMEQHFGAWQDRPADQVYAELGRRHPFWVSPAALRPPGGESFVELMARVAPAIERLSEHHAGRDIVVVAHGGTIRAALGTALDLDGETALRFAVDFLSLTRIDRFFSAEKAHRWRVVGVNHPPLS